MKIVLDSNEAIKRGLSGEEVLMFLLIKLGVDRDDILQSLIHKQAIVEVEHGYVVTQTWDDICSSILLASDKAIPEDSELEPLAFEMMKTFPALKMPGTPYYYKCNRKEVILKLKKFIKKYGKYKPEDILAATKRYVDSFNGDYRYMKLLKYFIMKDERRVDAEGNGYIEETSLLATELENKNSTNIQEDWQNELK